jgi:alkanesulfonate monooxygenase SsuD/methylene tetrahydromethanopterin reductase-like flavin-dependent oxidoreductase (luciferase family)
MTRQLHFNAFLMGCGHHEAAWRLPESDPFANLDLGHWTKLAQTAERGGFDSVFLADGPALWGNAKYRPGGALEPTVLLTDSSGTRRGAPSSGRSPNSAAVMCTAGSTWPSCPFVTKPGAQAGRTLWC